MRQAVLLFLFALRLYSDPEDSPGFVLLGVDKSVTCGGILIETDVVISAKSCLKPNTEVISRSFPSKIESHSKHGSADLVVLFLERSSPKTLPLIHISELGSLKQMLAVRFSNLESSVENWIDSLDEVRITAFRGLAPPLMGSPMWTDLGGGIFRAIGMMTGEKTALRLDPYIGFIKSEINFIREKRPKRKEPSAPERPLVVLPATPAKTNISIPARVVSVNPPPPADVATVAETHAEPPIDGPAVRPPPESLGCACSQVRRGGFNGRFLGRQQLLGFFKLLRESIL